MVVLGGRAVSYERGTPIERLSNLLATWTENETIPNADSLVPELSTFSIVYFTYLAVEFGNRSFNRMEQIEWAQKTLTRKMAQAIWHWLALLVEGRVIVHAGLPR